MALKKEKSSIGFGLPRFLWVTASAFLEYLSYLPLVSRIRETTYEIASEKIPPAFDGYTIAVLADLHGHVFGKDQKRLIRAVQRVSPDLILMIGDWVRNNYQGTDKKAVDAMILGLCGIAPFYGCMGNHEYYARGRNALIQTMESHGGKLLVDESVLLHRNGEAIKITGLDTYYQLFPFDAPPRVKEASKKALFAEYQWALANIVDGNPPDTTSGSEENASHTTSGSENKAPDKAPYTIVLGHRPENLDVYARLPMDLVLSGHAHGGLMRLPKGKRLLAPDQGLFPTMTHGIHTRNATTMLISEGLGGPRIFIRPQIVKVILKSRVSHSQEDKQ